MFDFSKFCKTYRIKPVTEGHKHARRGWQQIPCPFCSGHSGYHLGWNERDDYFNCWRCGFHPHQIVIQKLLRVNYEEAQRIVENFQTKGTRRKETLTIKADSVEFPAGTSKMIKPHKDYLKSRQFDPDLLERIWGLKGTGPIGSYRWRVIAPITYNGRLVSYQGRDISKFSDLRYKACPSHEEAIDHKKVLYGYDQTRGKDRCIVVEGITDVWRLGEGAVCTFGIEYTNAQVKLLRSFDLVFVAYDQGDNTSEEKAAAKQARKLASELSAFTSVEIIDIGEGDPGDLEQSEADNIMKELRII